LTGTARGRTWEADSPEATYALGQALGQSLVGGVVIGLVGPLGAGKTQLVRGVAAGNALDAAGYVSSPTFTLIHEYPGRLALYHVDAYRLKRPDELVALGFDELIRKDSAVVVEWADRVGPVLPEDALWIKLVVLGERTRVLSFMAMAGETGTAARCLARLVAAFR
jgi:tRNA threonylcarbamoyladenosine biosynthesis protein TsaE